MVAGDALASIAWRNGVSLGALLKANSLEVTSLIMPGRRLQIPPATRPIPTSVTSSTTAPTAAPAPAVVETGYLVTAGDALASIAWRHGVSLGALLKANSLELTSVILPGQRLTIPPATRQIPTSITSSSTPRYRHPPSAPDRRPLRLRRAAR